MDDEEIHKCLKLMKEERISFTEASAVIRGEERYEDVLSKKVNREKAKVLQEKHHTEWPLPLVLWDVDPARWHFSMDDHNFQSFRSMFPDAEVVWAETTQIIKKLATYSNRLDDPFLPAYRCKSAKLVVHLQEGGKVSPPMMLFDAGALHVAGGNHRLGWAKHLRQEKLPILIRGQDRPLIEKLLK